MGHGAKGRICMKKAPNSAIPRDVDAYLAALPRDARATLQRLRRAIKAAAPKASETISYRMPMFKYHGMLAGFAAFRDHCSLFMGPSVMKTYRKELKPYDTSKGTIRFPKDKPLPTTLVKKLVRSKIKENDQRLEKRHSRLRSR